MPPTDNVVIGRLDAAASGTTRTMVARSVGTLAGSQPGQQMIAPGAASLVHRDGGSDVQDSQSRGDRRLGAALLVTAGTASVAAQNDALTAEPDADCTPGTTGKIAFMLKQQTAFRYLNADIPFFTEAAQAAGYEVLVQSAENDATNQVAQAENVITQGVDAIVIQPVGFNVAGQIPEMATTAGIPLASYDDMILNAPHAAFIGRDPKAGGRSAAILVLAAVPEGNYALIGGDPGQTGSTQFQEGCHEVLDPLVADGKVNIVLDSFTPAWKPNRPKRPPRTR
jgi:D-xylose transport system substrate-binding protein